MQEAHPGPLLPMAGGRLGSAFRAPPPAPPCFSAGLCCMQVLSRCPSAPLPGPSDSCVTIACLPRRPACDPFPLSPGAGGLGLLHYFTWNLLHLICSNHSFRSQKQALRGLQGGSRACEAPLEPLVAECSPYSPSSQIPSASTFHLCSSFLLLFCSSPGKQLP